LRRFSYINSCKNCFLHCGLIRLPGTMIWTNLNTFNVRKLSCKFELFWSYGSWKKDFLKTSPQFCIFVIISPLNRMWSFIWTILKFPLKTNRNHITEKLLNMAKNDKQTNKTWRWFVPRFVENGLLVLEKIFFISVYFYSFAIISPWRRVALWTILDDLCQLWLQLVQWFWRKNRKCKILTYRRTTDNGLSRISFKIIVSQILQLL
jgi:hypothetical protein